MFWDLGIAFELPQGAEIYFPSGRFIHGNTELQPGETRYSMTSYSSGGLFEWVHRGGMPVYLWEKHLAANEGLEEEEKAAEERRLMELLDMCFPVCS